MEYVNLIGYCNTTSTLQPTWRSRLTVSVSKDLEHVVLSVWDTVASSPRFGDKGTQFHETLNETVQAVPETILFAIKKILNDPTHLFKKFCNVQEDFHWLSHRGQKANTGLNIEVIKQAIQNSGEVS